MTFNPYFFTPDAAERYKEDTYGETDHEEDSDEENNIKGIWDTDDEHIEEQNEPNKPMETEQQDTEQPKETESTPTAKISESDKTTTTTPQETKSKSKRNQRHQNPLPPQIKQHKNQSNHKPIHQKQT